jgi:hypothetical protein
LVLRSRGKPQIGPPVIKAIAIDVIDLEPFGRADDKAVHRDQSAAPSILHRRVGDGVALLSRCESAPFSASDQTHIGSINNTYSPLAERNSSKIPDNINLSIWFRSLFYSFSKSKPIITRHFPFLTSSAAFFKSAAICS